MEMKKLALALLLAGSVHAADVPIVGNVESKLSLIHI